ncbi:MAG: hypothetical protein WCC62_16375 [Pseudomonas capeferrum]
MTKDVLGVVTAVAGTLISAGTLWVAYALGCAGLHTWKRQLKGTSDHTLARSAAVAIYKYRDLLIILWEVGAHAIDEIESNRWISPDDDSEFSPGFFQSWLDKMRAARSELEAIAVECAAVWGGVFENGFTEIYRREGECSEAIETCLYLFHKGGFDDAMEYRSDYSQLRWLKFKKEVGRDRESVKNYIDGLFAPLVAEINLKQLKDN